MTMKGEGGWHSGNAPDDRFQDPAGWPELMAALDWLPVATLILAADGSAVAVNRAWVTLSAAARSDSRADGWLNAVEPADRATLRARLRGAAASRETGTAEFRLAAPAARGWSRWWWRPGPAGRLIVCAARTGDRQHRGDDRQPATMRGPLARFVPRSDFLNLAGRALRRRNWSGAAVAVLVTRIEAITGAGRTCSQLTSEQILSTACERILSATGPADAATRISSHEIAILCGDLGGPDEAGALASAISDAMAQPFEAGGTTFSVTTGTGLAIASAPSDTAETLLSAARDCAARHGQETWPQQPDHAPRRPAAYPPPGRDDQRAQPDCHLAQQGPQVRPHQNPDAVSVLDSVVRRAFRAGLALQNILPGSPQATAAIDRALGQLEEILREARDLAFQLQGTGTRTRPGPGSADANGT